MLPSSQTSFDEEVLSSNRMSVNEETEKTLLSDERRNHALEKCGKSIDHVLLYSEMSHEEDESSWYLDTGCSNHMTSKKDWVIDLDKSINSSVRFADNSVIMAEGVGKVLITHRDGRSAYVNNVLYVSSMKSNLLRLGQLVEKGYTMLMQQRHIEVFDERQHLVLKAPLSRNRMFKVNLKAASVQCFATVNTEDEQWL